jgi:hypothetical protein
MTTTIAEDGSPSAHEVQLATQPRLHEPTAPSQSRSHAVTIRHLVTTNRTTVHDVEPGLIGQLVATRPTVVSLGGLGTVVVTNQLLVRLVEEPRLRRVHGQDYLRYAACGSVRAWHRPPQATQPRDLVMTLRP